MYDQSDQRSLARNASLLKKVRSVAFWLPEPNEAAAPAAPLGVPAAPAAPLVAPAVPAAPLVVPVVVPALPVVVPALPVVVPALPAVPQTAPTTSLAATANPVTTIISIKIINPKLRKRKHKLHSRPRLACKSITLPAPLLSKPTISIRAL